MSEKMRPAKQIKVIRSQLEVLGDCKDQVDDLLRCICTVIQIGESWLEERDNKTFTDIYQFLTNQTAECISKCSSIPYGSEDVCQATDRIEQCDTPVTIPILKDDKEPSQILLRIESIENSITTNSKRIKTLNQKFKEREKKTKENCAKAEETERKSAEKYEKIMEELHAASSFMLNLQKETESLSQHIPEMESKCNDQLKDIEDKLHSANAFTLDMPAMICQVQELQKNFYLTNQMIDPLKQDVSDMSTVVTKLKASLDSFVVEQGKKLSDHEDEVYGHFVQLSQKIKDLQHHVGVFYVDVDSNKTML